MAINRHNSSFAPLQTLTPTSQTFTVDCSSGSNFLLDFNVADYVNESTWATPTYVGGKTFTATGDLSLGFTIALTDLTGGTASSPSEGDIVVIGVAAASQATNPNISISGYTELADIFVDDTNDTNLAAYYKAMSSTPDTDFSVAFSSDTLYGAVGVVHVWRNVDLGNILDTSSATSTGTNNNDITSPNITTVTKNAVVIAIGAAAHTGGADIFTNPGGSITNFLSTVRNSTLDTTIGIGAQVLTTPATFSGVSFTGVGGSTNTADSAAAITIALRPIQTFATKTTAAINFTNIPKTQNTFTVQTKAPSSMIGSIALTWDSDIMNYENITLNGSISANAIFSFDFYSNNQLLFLSSDNILANKTLYEKTEYINSTGNWTVPAGVNRIKLLLCGGGGGGTVQTSDSYGGAGSAIYQEISVVPGSTHLITLGAGGVGSNTAPTAGTSSSFGTLLSVDGGGTDSNGYRSIGGIGGVGETGTEAQVPEGYYSTKTFGYGEIYGRGGTLKGGLGPANTGSGGGAGNRNGGSGVAVITYWSAL